MTFKPIPFPANLQAIIFDVDGTLYLQNKLRSRLFVHLLPGFLRNPLHARRVLSVLTRHRLALEELRAEAETCNIADRQLQACCLGSGLPRETVERIVKTYFEDTPLKFLRKCRRPGFETFLASARAAGKLLGIVSDYPTEAKLQALELTNTFEAVLSASHPCIGRLKPHPAALLTCLEQLCVRPANAVYVGDRVDVDVPFALNADVHPIIIGNAPAGSRYSRVRSMHELSQLCLGSGQEPEVLLA